MMPANEKELMMTQAELVRRALSNVVRPEKYSFKEECRLNTQIKSQLPDGYRVLVDFCGKQSCGEIMVTVWAASGRIVKPDSDYPYANWWV
jgi:hypothetical protein